MGNATSEEEENELLEEAYSMSLESPEADKVLNQGTSAPNCQPKHTTAVAEKEDQGQEVVMKGDDESQADAAKSQQLNAKHRRGSSISDEEDRRKRQHTSGQQQQQQQTAAQQQQKKLSYFQMAKMGYQELVNAIIRPPRADYKVSKLSDPRKFTLG
jgi:hypothetical protein